jgi:hypothetical protein
MFKRLYLTKFLSFLLIFTYLFGSFSTLSLASLPDVYTLYNKDIDISDPKPFEVYLPYGNPYLEKEIDNYSLQVSIKGEGLSITSEEVYDYYLSDDDINKNLTFPRNKVLDCTNIPKYKSVELQKDAVLKPKVIKKEFFTENSIPAYLPYSAPNTQKEGKLPQKANGCIGLILKVNNKAKQGDMVEINLIPNTKQSASFEEGQRPGLVTQAIVFGDSKQAPKCDIAKQERFIKGNCVVECKSNEINNFDNGKCEVKTKTCQSFEDNVNGNCRLKCKTNETRDAIGSCTKPQTSFASFVDFYTRNNGLLYTILVLSVIIITSSVAWFLQFVSKKQNNL